MSNFKTFSLATLVALGSTAAVYPAQESTSTKGDVVCSVSLLSRQESKDLFGFNLHKIHVHPGVLSITNNGSRDLILSKNNIGSYVTEQEWEWDPNVQKDVRKLKTEWKSLDFFSPEYSWKLECAIQNRKWKTVKKYAPLLAATTMAGLSLYVGIPGITGIGPKSIGHFVTAAATETTRELVAFLINGCYVGLGGLSAFWAGKELDTLHTERRADAIVAKMSSNALMDNMVIKPGETVTKHLFVENSYHCVAQNGNSSYKFKVRLFDKNDSSHSLEFDVTLPNIIS